MQVDIYITEPQGIQDISAQYQGRQIAGRSADTTDLDDTIRRLYRYRSHVHYRPTRDEQLDYGTRGLDGDFVVNYDVFHTDQGSHSQVRFY